MYSLLLLRPGSLPLHPLHHYYPLYFSSAAAAASIAPTRLMTACSYNHIPTRTPGALSEPSHRSSSDRVAMYCANVFCRRRMYSSIVWNPASSLAIAAEVYVHPPSGFCRGICPARRIATWSWKPHMALPIQGVTSQVSNPKSNTACTTDLKKESGQPWLGPFPAEYYHHPLPHCPCP